MNEIIEYLGIPTPIVIIAAILLIGFCYWRITVLIDEIGDEVKKFNN
jgi:chromate transport protein ChrA